MKLELPDAPDITDININRLSKKRDEKILKEIIKPKDNVIQNLYQDNINLHKELVREFEKETNMYIDPEKQLKKEERAKEWDLEI